MEPCISCQGAVDTATRRCLKCGLVQPAQAPSSSLAASDSAAEQQEQGVSSLEQPGSDAPTVAQPFPGITRPPVVPALPARQGSFTQNLVLIAILGVLLLGVVGVGLYLIIRPAPSSISGGPLITSPSPLATATATATAALPTPTPTAALPTPTPTAIPPPLASTDMDGLHIQTNGLECPNQLVLKQPQDTYDDAALQQMRAYLGPFSQATDYGFANYPSSEDDEFFVLPPAVANHLPPVPDTLEWVSGGKKCIGYLDFTNTSTASIQIKSVDLTYDADSMANSFQYRLIDACSVVPETLGGPCQPPGQGGGPQCYNTAFQLQEGAAGTQVQGPIGSDDSSNCPLPLTLDPTKPVVQSVRLNITSALAQELYRVRLTVSITTTQGTQVLQLPSSFTTALAFASANQMSCDRLQGNTFTLEHSQVDPGFPQWPCV